MQPKSTTNEILFRYTNYIKFRYFFCLQHNIIETCLIKRWKVSQLTVSGGDVLKTSYLFI